MSAAPIASGARAALPRTAQPTVKTSPNVPMNSVTYLRMCDPLLGSSCGRFRRALARFACLPRPPGERWLRWRAAAAYLSQVDAVARIDDRGGFPGRVLDGNDLVVLAVQDQSRDIELLEVLGEIGLGEGLDGFVGVLQPGLHA